MKKYLLSSLVLLSLVFTQKVFAQPTVSGVYLPVVNTEIRQVWSTDSAHNHILAPQYGANMTWDYSNSFPIQTIKDTFALRSISPDNPEVQNLAGQPIHQYFPEATMVTYVRSPLPSADSLWSFFKVDTGGLHNIGAFALKSPANSPLLIFDDTTINFIDDELIVPFNVNYGATYVDTTIQETFFDLNILGTIKHAKLRHQMNIDMEVPGWGTLITPLDTYNDVLLGVATYDVYDSIYLFNNSTQDYTDLMPTQLYPSGLSPHSMHKRHYFIRNNTFASNLLMQINTDTSGNYVQFGWYVLPTKVGSIKGTVYDDISSTTPITSGKVLLYREHGNFIRDDILDSADIATNGTYTFTDIPFGMYRIAARPDSLIYSGMYTTYYSSDTVQHVTWMVCDTCPPVTLLTTIDDTTTVNDSTVGVDIFIKHHTPQTNYTPNQLQGYVGYVNTLKEGSDDPIPGIDIIIERDPSVVPIISTQTDENGNYTLQNLEDGSYTIWVDIPGLDLQSSYHFEIVDGVYNRCDFDFGATDSILDKTGQDVICITSIQQIQEKTSKNIYPNPFEDFTTLALQLPKASKVTVQIFDITGKLIQTPIAQQTLEGNQNIEIKDIKNSGIYFAKVTIDETTKTIRLIKL